MSAAVERAGRRAVRRAIDRLAERLRDEVPGADIATTDRSLAVRGRALDEVPALRWPAGLLR